MTERNTIQKPNPRSYSESHHSQTQAEVNELESPPPSYEAAVIGTDDRNQEGRQAHSQDVNEPAGAFHSLNQQQQGHQQQLLERQRQQLDQQLEQQRQQRELQRQQLGQQLEEQRHQQQQQQQELQQQLQHQLQQQQRPYPIQEYSSSNHHNYQPDAKHPNASQQDYYDLEAQQPTVAGSSSGGIRSSIAAIE
ncbi:unnamed protein product [Sordaria macrospora k-hell]|uniref:WGS project CABT00000000 data, contig 2.49 n=1 Tax=Sordaria macrospora (strain ATCC MYA-333 / DSM 997 / K(L3346) / K-hell) TaxID=771870 RepID=F7W938_SORMK|nr:uncharacterized protein SMAC_07856 [Sordaria macrospora k-hell]CCC05118.1 unnamed protein product [Sordaria macrospora k-hell]